jgi:uncharacterized protein (TIGR00251 family)
VAARLSVRVQPRASRSEVTGWHDGALRVRLTAPPVDGAANKALLELLAGALGVPRGDVKIVQGQTGRAKVVEIEHLEAEQLAERIAEIIAAR